MTDLTRTPYCTKIRYGVTGAPILTESEMDGSYAPGVGVAPVLIELNYHATLKDRPAYVHAAVTGVWTRFGKREQPESTVNVHFKNGPDGWPTWLAEEARIHDPAAVPAVVPPADRAAVLLDAVGALDRHLEGFFREWPEERQNSPWVLGWRDATAELRRVAGETQQPGAQAEVCGAWGGCPLPRGHNRGQADIPENHRAAPAVVVQPAEPAETEARISPTEELLATRCDACRHTLNRHVRHGACTVALCVCGTFQYPDEWPTS